MGEIITEYKKTVDSDCTLPILTSSKTEGVILQEEHFGRKQQHDITGYNILPRNYCTYRNRSDGVDFTFNINKCCDKGIISKFYPVFSGKNSDVFFLSLVLNNSDEVVREIAYTCTGTGQKVLSFLDLQKMKVRVPSFDEQKEIATYFDSLDHLITLHQQKLTLLTKLKKAMLEKMFPKKGSVIPEFRFNGFANAWEQRKLGEVGKCQSGIGFPDVEQGGKTGTPFYKVSDMNNYGNEHEMTCANNYVTNEQIVRKNWKPITEVPAVIFAKVGAAIMLNRKRLCRFPFLLDNNTMAYKFGEKWDTNFGKTLFEKIDLTELVQVGALPSYNVTDVENLDIKMPIDINEQKVIGEFFANLDTLITLHQRKIDKIKNMKKAMLDQMFI